MKKIYLIQSLEDGYYKIGISKNPEKRLKQLQTGNSNKLKLIETFSSEYSSKIEKTLHRRYSHYKKEGEWFDIALTESFTFKEKCEEIENNIKILKNNKNIFI